MDSRMQTKQLRELRKGLGSKFSGDYLKKLKVGVGGEISTILKTKSFPLTRKLNLIKS